MGISLKFGKLIKQEQGTEDNADKYKATYYQGYISEFTPSATAEDSVELSLSFAINGIGQDGYATLTENQAEVVQYTFKDTVKSNCTFRIIRELRCFLFILRRMENEIKN